MNTPATAKTSAETRLAVVSAIPAFCEAMANDYATWSDRAARGLPANRMLFDLDMGKKFIRVWSRHEDSGSSRSAHSFIVMEDCTVKTVKGTPLNLRAGDILKVATWKAPALNFVRGNVLDKNYGNCKWTGAA
jgi:hypothetical protein